MPIRALVAGSIFFLPAFAAKTILWATPHSATSSVAADQPCNQAHQTFFDAYENDYDALQKVLPGLVYAEEEGGQKVLGIDDPTLRQYLQLPSVGRAFVQFVEDRILTDPQDSDVSMLASRFTLFANLVFKFSDQDVPARFERLVGKERSQAIDRVRLDLSIFRSYNPENPENAKIWMFSLILEHQNDRAIFAKEAQAIREYLGVWIRLAAALSQDFGNRGIFPNAKYDLAVDLPGTEYDGRTTFALFRSGKIYTYEALRSEAFARLMAAWRDHFIAKKVAAIIAQNPQKPILVWMGEGHIDRVAELLRKERAIQPEDVLVLTANDEPRLACDLDGILNQFLRPTLPTLDDWVDAHAKPVVTLWTLQGERKLRMVVAIGSDRNTVLASLSSQPLPEGVYLLEIAHGTRTETTKVVRLSDGFH